MKPTEVIETTTSEIRIDEEGILRIHIKQNARVDIEEVKKVFDVFRELSRGEKMLELMEGGDFFTFDDEAQKYVAKHGKDIFIASALLNKSTGMRILFNFFNTFFNQPVPFKMFTTEEKALRWLRGFKK